MAAMTFGGVSRSLEITCSALEQCACNRNFIRRFPVTDFHQRRNGIEVEIIFSSKPALLPAKTVDSGSVSIDRSR